MPNTDIRETELINNQNSTLYLYKIDKDNNAREMCDIVKREDSKKTINITII